MRAMVTSVFLWALLLAAWIDARPQELGTVKAIRADMAKEKNVSDAWNNSTTTSTSMKPKDVGSRVEPTNAERDLKGYQYMDNSLRTVATQLFNVSSVKEDPNINDNTMLDKEESRLGLLIHKPDNPTREILSERDHFNDNIKSDKVAIESVDVGFDRSTNSKYNYFKTSHPGEAMALTEEDLERDLVLTKLMTSHKKKPTTTGGISTWILLNPPSTTVKSLTSDKAKDAHNKRENTKKTTLNLKSTVPTVNIDTTVTSNLTTPMIPKNSPTRATPVKGNSAIKQSSTSLKMEKLTSQMVPHTTPRLETTKKISDGALKSTTPRTEDGDTTTLKTTTKRIVSSSRTPKPAITTPKTTTVISQTTTIKIVKPINSNQSTKSNIIRKVTSKPESTKNPLNATSKIEKVTFKPVQMITTPKSTMQQSVPMFITKLHASLNTDSKSNNPASSTAFIESIAIEDDIPKTNITFTKRVQATLKQKPSKPNNVLNVQLKKPVDTRTRIEIQPIKVNTPVLTIEKVEDEKKDIEINDDKPIAMGDSKIDVKFVFNPELTKIVETPIRNTATTVKMSTVTTTTTTTKRPKQKRKKNKTRRRKPSSSTTSSPITTTATAVFNTIPNNVDANQENVDNPAIETSLQESKIVPDSEASPNNTKNKKKQVQKPITSQIYSFLSREVMPSVGVMSLVGLGLGLASYFLYPFGGTISRRNYEIEPNYKYNLNEYGGNYGQSEEEVFSKVLQGMTTSNVNYGGMKDYENNYYRYQAYDGAYTDPSHPKRKGDIRYSATSSVPIYRPDNAQLTYTSKYRKNEFHYPDLSTTPKYYERHAESEFMNNQGSADRQFVVGNIPKGYSYEKDQSPPKLSTTTESTQTDFEKQIAQSLKFVENPVHIPPNFEQPEAQALKANEGYDEIEIAPTAVAVEHGPRSLKLEKLEASVQDISNKKNIVKMRRKRDSFIQQIPTRSEMDKMENEEDLSNEILDVIDSTVSTMLPEMVEKNVKRDEAGNGETGKPMLASSTSSTLYTMSESEKNKVEDGKITPTIIQSSMTSKEYSNATIESTATSKNVSTSDKTAVTTADSLESSTTSSSIISMSEIIVTTEKSENTTAFSDTIISNNTTTAAPLPERFNFLKFVKKIAELKFRIGVTVLKHASESFAKYLGNVQKKLNGEE